MMTHFVHLVTMLNEHAPDRAKTVGCFLSFAQAENEVLDNKGDMFEGGFYDLAVIESFPEGVNPQAEQVAWYRADFSQGPDNKPEVVNIPPPGLEKGSRSSYSMG